MSSTIKAMLAVWVLFSTLASFTSFAAAAAAEHTASWNNLTHQPHYADINGDGFNDLLLQAIDSQHSSSWVNASASHDGYIQYHQTNQQQLNLDLINSKVQLADFNGDGFADLLVRQAQGAVTYFGGAQGFDLTTVDATTAINHPAADWQTAPSDFESVSGDFNGDGYADLLLLSQTNQNHQLLHSNGQGQLSLVQSINKNVKWGKVNSDKLLVADFNADGKDDIFAHAKAQSKKHYVVYANTQGKLKPSNTEQIKAQITDVDWHGDAFSVVAGFADNDNLSEVVRFNNALGGIDENGIIYDEQNKANKNQHGVAQQTKSQQAKHSYTPKSKTQSTTQSLLSAPATPTSYPNTDGSSYKPANIGYNITYNAVSGANRYELYEAAGSSSAPSDSAYRKIYDGSALYKNNISHSNYGYQYYRYKACNGTSCSGLSPWRRVVIYTTPSTPSYINLTTTGIAPGHGYRINFGASNGSVDGRTGTGANTWSARS